MVAPITPHSLLAEQLRLLFHVRIIACLFAFCVATFARSQDRILPEPIELLQASQRVATEQVDELIRMGEPQEALSQIMRLAESPTPLIERASLQRASTQRAQVYQALGHWCRDQLKSVLSQNPKLHESYRASRKVLAETAFQALQQSKDVREGARYLAQYHAAPAGPDIALLLADINLEREGCLSAMLVIDQAFSKVTRCDLPLLDQGLPPVQMPWHRIWQAVGQDSTSANRLLSLWSLQTADTSSERIDVLVRQLIAATISPEHIESDAILAWASAAADHLVNDPESRRVREAIEMAKERLAERHHAQPDSLSAAPGAVNRISLAQWPQWRVQLSRFTDSSDLTPATRPAVGRMAAAIPYYPVIYDNKVFVHELTRIQAFDLTTGQAWPGGASNSVLFDTQIAPEAYLPLGYPLQGLPRGELTLYEGCLYARTGSPVTAWANRTRSSSGSGTSRLIGLDLDRQGIMLHGFPIELDAREFPNAEFDGCPAVSGQNLIVAIAERDHADIRRSLVAFDRFNGQLKWRSKVLGSGPVVGSQRCNLIAHTQPIMAGELVYYASDLGTVSCLDASTGQIHWLTSYQRSSRLTSAHPHPDRFRYRDGSRGLLHKGLLYCLPQDCPELIALDAMTGDLVWATDDIEVADCTQLVGVQGQTLLASGDRLVWLDRTNGRLAGRFPELPTPGVVNSLPSPRGLGQAAMSDGRVYWPISGEILVFPADLVGIAKTSLLGSEVPPWSGIDSPPMLERFQLQASGGEGGNLVAAGPWFVMATPGTLMGIHAQSPASEH